MELMMVLTLVAATGDDADDDYVGTGFGGG